MGGGRDATGLATPDVVSPPSSLLDSLRLHAVGVRILGGHVDASSRQQATPPQTAGLEDDLLKRRSAPGLFPEHPELLSRRVPPREGGPRAFLCARCGPGSAGRPLRSAPRPRRFA